LIMLRLDFVQSSSILQLSSNAPAESQATLLCSAAPLLADGETFVRQLEPGNK